MVVKSSDLRMVYMSQDDTALQISEIYESLKDRYISTGEIALYQKKSRITDYLVDHKYILRISNSALDDQMKQNRAKSISLVPKIHSSGSFTVSGRQYYYLIADYVQGDDLWSVIQNLTNEQKINIGKEIAQFLSELHSITDTSYDIGHYVAAIPRCRKSWKDGHLEYAEMLRSGLSQMDIKTESKKTVSKAFDYIDANSHSLEYQTGARLLHNDFHPKNIIVREGRLAGIIDWECSQFGEADFELAHLFHWCIYPSIPDKKLGSLLKSVVENLPNVPNLEKRLTIYQLEHELNQLIWNGTKQEDERMQRMNGWLDGQVDGLFEEWQLE
jgi:aminoglycoside phosphotransferase (APT) family kinase protein